MANKKNVPQEHQQFIIDLYVNKQYGFGKIKQKLKEQNLTYSDRIIKRILHENNIHIRNFNEAKVGRYKLEVSEELKDEICDLYLKGYGLEKIVEILQTSFSFDKIKSILQERNIHIRTLQESAQIKIMPDLRKYPINDNYNLISHNGAWILGMYAADGYLPITKGAKYRITLSLAEKDEEILHRIAAELEYEGPIYHYKQKLKGEDYPFVSLSFSSKILREKFESYGIVNAKTFKLEHLPSIPDEYMLDFIRGFIDGDGSIMGSKTTKVCLSITCASENFLKEIASFFKRNFNISEPTIHQDHNNKSIRYYKQDTLTIGALLYHNDYLALERKKKHFLAIENSSHEP